MITLKHILVPTDFSESSDAALRYGRDLARGYGATLHVLHVTDDLAVRYNNDLFLMLPANLQEGATAEALQVICEGFRASDGYVVAQIVREPQFAKLAELIGHPEWNTDPRFETRAGWGPNLESVIRPAVDAWASQRTKVEAARELTAAGIAAGPSNHAPDVIADEHIAARHMLVEMPRTDGVAEPVLVPGNPVKLSKMTEGPEARVPWVGEHTAEVLEAELGLSAAEVAALRDRGVVT